MGVFCTHKPNSVRTEVPDDHIPRGTVASALLRLSWDQKEPSTALHAGKDLAVSPSLLLERLFPI